MDQILEEILSTIGGVVGSAPVQLGIRAIAIYFVILWLAAAYWAFRDAQLRTENPFLPYVAASLIIVFTPIFFPFAIFVYRIVRPQEKIGDVYERNLAEEALLAEVESVQSCPTCARRVDDEWLICPTCRTKLSRVCPSCSRLVGLQWSLCAWCGRDFEHREQVAYQPLPERQQEEVARLPGMTEAPTTVASRTMLRSNRPLRAPAPARAGDALTER